MHALAESRGDVLIGQDNVYIGGGIEKNACINVTADSIDDKDVRKALRDGAWGGRIIHNRRSEDRHTKQENKPITVEALFPIVHTSPLPWL